MDEGCVKLYLMPKHQFALWLLAQGRIQTKDRIPYEICKICPLCQDANETIDHTFFGCSVSKALWSRTRAWLGMRHEMGTSKRVLKIFHWKYRGSNTFTKARHLVMSCMIHLLWQVRNRCQYEGESPNIERMFVNIQTHVFRFVCV